MPQVNTDILVWARETASFSREDAVKKLNIRDARGMGAVDRLVALETGQDIPSRPLLLKMAKQYRRPLLTFYLSAPPRKGNRGQDFRTLPKEHTDTSDAILDALIRDVLARQSIVRSILDDEEETEPLRFVNSLNMSDGVSEVLASIRKTLGVDVGRFRQQKAVEDAFALLRQSAEAVGVFVLLIGNLGSHHSVIDLETFRGFALADPVAPFIVINDQDAKSAWSFTLLHELAHLWLGATGVSGSSGEMVIERFCNDVASEFLLPSEELSVLDVDSGTDLEIAVEQINTFAGERHVSPAMVAYKLHRSGVIGRDKWRCLEIKFREQRICSRDERRERNKERDGGPDYYVVKRHRIGAALIDLVKRTMNEGNLTPSKAGKVLGVKPTNVEALVSSVMSARPGPVA
ncbi:MAG: ImmA/IrrE family metallo-endopeptidase [Sphingomonadales bacterium]